MTKKDYIKFAALFAGEIAMARTNEPLVAETVALITLRNVILSTADIFAQDNHQFDREKFYTACGL